MNLEEKIKKLKKDTFGITTNPILDAFDLMECKQIDDISETDSFVKSRRDSCLNQLKSVKIDFQSEYRTAFEDYNEAAIYIDLKTKLNIEGIIESDTKTPDFKIRKDGECSFELNAELKSLSFADGNLNYIDAQEQAIEAQINIETQLSKGKKIAFGITEISPLHKSNVKYDLYSTKYVIERFIDKISQNIKKGQFTQASTILMIDIKQLALPSNFKESCVSLFIQKAFNSIVSGVLWNVAFGKVGHLLYKPSEFEGRPNTDGELERNGILVEYPYIKGLVVIGYENFEIRKYVGFYRYSEIDTNVINAIQSICSFVNDDKNSHGWQIVQNNEK